MDRRRTVLAAASMRFLMGLLAVSVLPVIYPEFGQHRWLFGIYLAQAGVSFFLIYRDLGGLTRSVVGGLIDIALLTFLVHRLGSVQTMLVSVYFLLAMLNTLVVRRRVGMLLAVIACVAYNGVLIAETAGMLPYAPDAPEWLPDRLPGVTEALVAGGVITLILLATTYVTGVLVHTNQLREQQLEELSTRDPLTHLYNRRHLVAHLEKELERVRRGGSLCVCMIDLDRFKRVNDEHGHLEGDSLLIAIARALDDATRAADVAGRYGGDELVVLLQDAEASQAETAAGRFADAIREVGRRFDPERPVTASVGVATARSDDDARALLQRADELAYEAKERGGDQVASEPSARERARAGHDEEPALRSGA